MPETVEFTIRLYPQDIERLGKMAETVPGATRAALARDLLMEAVAHYEREWAKVAWPRTPLGAPRGRGRR